MDDTFGSPEQGRPENSAVSFPQAEDSMVQGEKKQSVFGAMGNFGSKVMGKINNFFAGAEDDEAPVIADDIDDEFVKKNNPVKGFGYSVSYCHYQDLSAHPKSFFFTSPLGDPFPSYHSNPMPDFSARWTLIPNVKMPCESLTAPRIRLAPTELKIRQHVLGKMRDAASKESQAPKPHTLDLAHQTLGDPYQYEAFVTFWDINKGAQVLNLTDNELDDITDLDLTSVRKLYLSRNNFSTFENLPELPNCEQLYLNDNFITGIHGIDEEKFPKLRKLEIKNNPVQESGDKYLDKIKDALPNLEWLNDVPVEGWIKWKVPQ